MSELKIVTIDIESMADAVWSWGTRGKEWNAVGTIAEWHLFCCAVKWYGKKTKIYSLDQYKGYKPMLSRNGDSITITKPNERKLLEDIWKVLDVADIVIGWNSKRFDVKKIQSKLLAYGFPPPSPFRQIDIMVEKKKVAASNSNKLDLTGEEWGLGRKLSHHGFPLWLGCAEGDTKSWRLMKKYNIQDVILTEQTYIYLRPWITTHPNLAVTHSEAVCPKCLSRNLIGKGPAVRANTFCNRWKCKDCRGNFYTNMKDKLPLKPH